MKLSRSILITINLILLIALIFTVGLLNENDKVGDSGPTANAKAGNSTKSRVNLPSFSPMVKKLKPSVVYVVVSGTDPNSENKLPENHPDIPPDAEKGVGSGFIISRSGYILTNDHVVSDANEVEVVLTSGNKYSADVIGRDPQLDVALVKITPKEKLKPIKFGSSNRIDVGDWVLAMGNPYGLENNVTIGVISGKGRELAEAPFIDFLQTDAAIYPGNSGGPLVDLKGRAVGINTAVVPGTQLGFSIPIDKVEEILPELKRYGHVTRGYIGIEMAPVSPQLPDEAITEKGVFVTRVRSGPAKKAGIRAHDIIIEYDGKTVSSPNDLAKLVDKSKPGNTVRVKITRNGRTRTYTITIAKPPTPGGQGPQIPHGQDG